MILETMSAEEAVEALGINLSAVYQAVHSPKGKLQAVRCGTRIRILKQSAEEYKRRVYGDRRKEEGADKG